MSPHGRIEGEDRRPPRTGPGRTWVLLRGLAREARHWGSFPQVLQQHLPPGDRVVALDLPGNGRLWHERSPAAVDAMVQSVRSRLRAQRLEGPCVVVALSLGGMVAVEWARQAPQDVAACVLINSSLGGLSPFWQRLRPRCYAALLRLLVPGTPVARRERIVLRLTSALPVEARVLEDWVRYARTRPVTAANVLRQLAAAARFRAPAQLHVPGLVIVSAGDRLVSPRCSAAMARVWDYPLRVHAGAGHDLPLDDPAWLAREIGAWAAQGFAAGGAAGGTLHPARRP